MVGPKKILNWMSINVDPDVIARYQKKNKVPPAKKPVEFETRYHRTHSKNAPSIDKQGLLTFNPNIGKNTYLSNADDYHNIWLANNATEIPVLRGLLKDSPQDVTTYKVRMPKQWYLESPRFYMPGGRGAGKLKPQPKDKPRLTDEGAYKIDLIGNDIPRQYLQKLPVFNRDRVDLIGIIDDINPNIDRNLYHDVTNNLLGEFRNYNRVFGKGPKYNKPVSQTWARITPSEELLRFMFPITYKYDIYRDFLQTANKLKHDFASLPPGIQVSPREMLDRTLSMASYALFPETGVLGSNVTAKLKPTDITQLAQGSISRAIEDLPEFETAQKLRRPSRMDWDAFNMYYNAGHSPKRALMEGYVPGQYISWINDEPRAKQLKLPSFGEGAISRGMPDDAFSAARTRRAQRTLAAKIIRREREKSRKYLSRELGRQPAAEELDAWTRVGIFNKIAADDMFDPPAILSDWAGKWNDDIATRISKELFKRMEKKATKSASSK